ncbi:hypothetical protein [Runella sp. SP2]|uniref:hypothetical protein n=1 Tax=Runella sp. SP2 TaxID=2268026 RepID=UPI000F08CCDA|nr:hypothetical protein [Runella sp. SP2]AYQ36596.1 hypothetical protein DTQ70_30205 [Runella sp. SP2]
MKLILRLNLFFTSLITIVGVVNCLAQNQPSKKDNLNFKSAQEAINKYEVFTDFTMQIFPSYVTAGLIKEKIAYGQKRLQEFKKLPEFEGDNKSDYVVYIRTYIRYCDLSLQILENRKNVTHEIFKKSIEIQMKNSNHVGGMEFEDDLKQRLITKFTN